MFLVIYSKNQNLFHNFQEKLSGTFNVTDSDFNNYRLTGKDRIRFFKMKSWNDFWGLRDKLKKYKLQIIILKNVYKDRTEIGMNVFLLNNQVRSLLLTKKDIGDNLLKEDEVKSTALLIDTFEDFENAEKEFEFTTDIKNLIFGDKR